MTKNRPRPSWEEYCLMLAHTAKARSEDIHRAVGACALDWEHRVLGVAYNGLAPGKKVPPEFWLDRDKRRPFCIHAETNLLSLIKRKEASVIAVTTMPCSNCATAICAYSIPCVVYSEGYPEEELTKEVFAFYGVKLMQISEIELRKYGPGHFGE